MREVSTTRQEAALFNAVFSEKNALNSASTVQLPVYGPHSVPAVTVWEVRWALQQLRPTSAPDNDGIFFWLPQTFSDVLEPRLARADTRILWDRTTVPASWGRCTLTSPPKPGRTPDAAEGDRPVRITSLLSSVCERLALERALLATHGQRVTRNMVFFVTARRWKREKRGPLSRCVSSWRPLKAGEKLGARIIRAGAAKHVGRAYRPS
ncbi:putative Endonuclease-reverse transcriptase/Reverse transcriptase (RNA-dependent DNA polymerase) [Trypanosoma cruzi]|uniref:Putative Endonuclease-reverse transcriptase/Reverse transcriptase (RNA-dependent DNA polymerase) n=1 Tax=Trypanosoma cruzi TaxID=5693 RepID=A0A2V2XPE3_TRYCR|nr:putative Endonuclease-reverse transcriptase/Reverse transcriptase (RNA-dependent DNA polymerase) [Trypanosoma cruzi]PWV20604.1 putative Endonuclease-reverse transcriptase/Reverse transcriptase (RNA-dependent DNA polymerase) [Trypanosoma cruzi]RNC39209.1 hypothetical protein TcCL_NonESM11473 [Trypanosoma cruzi]